jgi:hypothetical protein
MKTKTLIEGIKELNELFLEMSNEEKKKAMDIPEFKTFLLSCLYKGLRHKNSPSFEDMQPVIQEMAKDFSIDDMARILKDYHGNQENIPKTLLRLAGEFQR